MLNNFQPIPQPVVSPPDTTPTDETGPPRRSAFAAMSDLQEQFSAAGIETSQVWEFIKAEYSVDSRAKLTAPQLAIIAAQLNSARRDAHMFKIFVSGIPDFYFRIHVFSDDPSVAIGRPRDTGEHHISAEWGDFQAIANENQCNLTVRQGKRTTYFEPKSPITPPAPVSTVESPKMPSGLHQNSRLLNGINATLKISGKWLTAPAVFSQYYDKYNLVDLRDIEIGLDILAKADEIESKVVEGGNQYFLPISDFERLLNRCQAGKLQPRPSDWDRRSGDV